MSRKSAKKQHSKGFSAARRRTHFKGKGNIESIRIGTRPDGRSKGYSHITFATAADADKALTLNSSELAGRQVVVKKAAERTQSE
jgi:RNA recognition motif-containing protein